MADTTFPIFNSMGDMGYRARPFAPAFEQCARELGVASVAHVGDSLEHDIAGLRRAG